MKATKTRPRSTDPGSYLVETVQIDASQLDCHVIAAEGPALGRARLTVAIDPASRQILGFWLGAPPTAETAED